MPETLKTYADFQACIKDNRLVAVDFTATWCGPCRMIGPKFAELDDKYPNIKFVKVDVDENSETAEKNSVSAMPTFKFFKDGEERKDIVLVGASEEKLKESLNKLSEM